MKKALWPGLGLALLAVLVTFPSTPKAARAEEGPDRIIIDITYVVDVDRTRDLAGDFELSGAYEDAGRSTQTYYEEHADGTYTSVHELRSKHGTIVVQTDVGPFPHLGTFTVLSGTRAYEGLQAEGETLAGAGGSVWAPDRFFVYYHLDSDPPPNVPPTVSLGATAVSTSPYTYKLNAVSSDEDGYLVKFEWDFTGDGVWDAVTVDQSWTTWTYPGVGTYHPVVRVTDNDGASATATRELRVSPFPTVTITAPPNGSTVSGIVTVAASVTNAGSLSFRLDGVGGTDLGSVPASAFDPWTGTVAWDTTAAANGGHTITAVASGADGFLASASIQVTVANAILTPSIAAIAPGTIAAGSTVLVTVTGTSFRSGATLAFANGSGLTPVASHVFVVSPSQLTAFVTVARNGPPGSQAWDVVVTNPDGRSGSLPAGLTVLK